MEFTPAPSWSTSQAGDSIFGMIMSRVGAKTPLVDMTADTFQGPSQSSSSVLQAADRTETSTDTLATVPVPSGETPMERLQRNLEASGRSLDEMSLPGDEAQRLEDLMVRSGYEREAAQGIIERSRDEDGNINLGKLFKNIKDNPPSDGPTLALPISAQPMFMQILQQLGVDPEKVRQFFEALPRQGDMLMVSGVKDLLAEAGAAAKEVDTSVLKDLLTSLGLTDKEAEALMFKAADSQSRFSPQDLMNMLKAAAATQGEALTRNLKQMAARIQNATPAQTTSDAAAIKSQVDEILRGDKTAAAAKNAAASETQREAARAQNGQAKDAANSAAQDQQKNGEQSFKEMIKAGATNDPALAREAAGLASTGSANAARTGQSLGNANGASGQSAAQGTAEAMGTHGASQAGGAGGARAGLPTYVVRQVGTQLAQMAKQGQQVLRFNLRPAHLGQLNLRLEVAEGSLKATLVAESVAAKGILESGLGQLKDQLAAQGLKIERFEVQVDPDAQRGDNQAQQHDQAQSRHGSAQGSNGAQGSGKEALAGALDADDDTALYDQDGRLSVFA